MCRERPTTHAVDGSKLKLKEGEFAVFKTHAGPGTEIWVRDDTVNLSFFPEFLYGLSVSKDGEEENPRWISVVGALHDTIPGTTLPHFQIVMCYGPETQENQCNSS